MNIRYTQLSLLFLSFFLLATSCGEDEQPQQDFTLALEEIDVSYGGDALQTYDLHLPANRSSATTDVIVLIHGGGWTSGDKDDVTGIVDLLKVVMPEYAIVNLNYRLDIDPENLFGDHMEDLKLVVEDIANRSNEIGVSKDMVMTGVSAGGHMSLLYAYANNTNNYVKVVGNIIGPTYFLDPSYISGDNPTWALTLRAITDATGRGIEDTDYYGSVSPLLNVTSSTIPTIQFLGDEDPLIPTTQGTLLQAALNDAGVPNELIIYEGEGHGWTNPDNWSDTALRFRDFVEQHKS